MIKLVFKFGVSSDLRWTTWRIVQNYNKECVQDLALIDNRRKIYQRAKQIKRGSVEDIVEKDVLRT